MAKGCILNKGSERKVVAAQWAHTEIMPSHRAGPRLDQPPCKNRPRKST